MTRSPPLANDWGGSQYRPTQMSVRRAVEERVSSGSQLRTPSRGKPFVVHTIDGGGVVLLLGAGRWPTRLSWECLEGVVPFIREHGGEVDIGGRHEVEGNPGTLDEWLKG